MSQIVPQTIMILMTSSLVLIFLFFFGGGGIKLKFGEGVNSETLILFFMSVLPKRKIIDKDYGGLRHFFSNFTRPLFNKTYCKQ